MTESATRTGADPLRGSGLTGLHDQIAAHNGLLEIASPPGEGTHLHASLPIDLGGAGSLGAAAVAV